jgi:hypothetical protein
VKPLLRPLPHGPWWAFALGIVLLLAGFALSGWLSAPFPLVICVVGIIVFSMWRGFRCPQCGRKMRERRAPIDGGPAYRIFYECTQCEALWDAEMKFDPTDD